jgi:lipid-binding SYLF domain-containing protein
MNMARINKFSALVFFIVTASMIGCATPKGASPAEKRLDVERMRTQALEMFHDKVPSMREDLKKAPGYGVFSGYSTQTIIVSTGNGFGVIRDNTTGKDTYMRAAKLGGGLGAGLEDVFAVVVFSDSQTMNSVLTEGWGVTGKAGASAQVGDTGASGAMVVTLPGMSIYRFTKSGVMLGGAVEGVKVWPDDELNIR